MSATPLNQLLGQLVDEPEARTAFEVDPAGFLARSGHVGLDPSDIQEALGVMADGMPTVETAVLAETITLVDTMVANVESGSDDPFENSGIDAVRHGPVEPAEVDDTVEEFGSGEGGDSAQDAEDFENSLEDVGADLDPDLAPTADFDQGLLPEPDPFDADDLELGSQEVDIAEDDGVDDLEMF